MYAYRILLFSLLVISVAANNITIAEEDWDKLIASAKSLCHCTIKPIEEISAALKDCNSNETNPLLYMDAVSKAPIVKVCEIIRDINNKLKPAKPDEDLLGTDNDTLGNHNETNSEIKHPDADGSAKGSEPNRTHVGGNNGTEGMKPNCTNMDGEPIETTDGFGSNCTHKDRVIVNGSEILGPNRTHINGPDNETKLYEGNTTEASPIVTERTYTSNDTITELIEDMNVTTSSTVGSNVTKPTIEPKSNLTTERPLQTSELPVTQPTIKPKNNSTTERPLQTSERPDTHSTAAPLTEEKKYALATIVITFFCSFGAGILIAVGSKLLYSRYRERTYVIPAEQELH